MIGDGELAGSAAGSGGGAVQDMTDLSATNSQRFYECDSGSSCDRAIKVAGPRTIV